MIKQRVHTRLRLLGDGTSTTYSFDLGKVYGLNFTETNTSTGDVFSLIDSGAIPDSVSVTDIEGISTFLAATATVSRRTVTLDFSGPFDVEIAVEIALEFNG